MAGKLNPADPAPIVPEPTGKSFKSGLALDEKKGVLYSLDINDGTLTAIPLNGGKPNTVLLVGRPYDIAVGPGGTLLYVSDWAGKQILAVDAETLKIQKKIAVGEHPNRSDGLVVIASSEAWGRGK